MDRAARTRDGESLRSISGEPVGMLLVNYLVHGVALAAQPLVFLGLLGVSRYLQWSDSAVAALVVYGFGIVAALSPAVLSGFVAPGVIARLDAAAGTLDARYQALLVYTGFVNQGFAKVNVVHLLRANDVTAARARAV